MAKINFGNQNGSLEINLMNNWANHKNDIADCTKYVADAIIQDKFPKEALEEFLLQIFKRWEWLQLKPILSEDDIYYVSNQLEKIEAYWDKREKEEDNKDIITVSWWAKQLQKLRKENCQNWNPKLPNNTLFTSPMLQQIIVWYAVSKLKK